MMHTDPQRPDALEDAALRQRTPLQERLEPPDDSERAGAAVAAGQHGCFATQLGMEGWRFGAWRCRSGRAHGDPTSRARMHVRYAKAA